MRAIIIDDEPKAITVLQVLLQNFCPNVTVAATTSRAEEAITLLEQHRPDIVFLDIEMPEINGIDLGKLIGTYPTALIYVTAHEAFILDALRMKAADYLLKPVKPSELIHAIGRVESAMQPEQNFSNDLSGKKILINQLKRTIVLSLSEVLYFKADGAYTWLQMNSGEVHMASKSLGYYEEEVRDFNFYRIHRTYLINLRHVSEITSENYVRLSDALLPVARANVGQLRLLLGGER